MSDVICEWKNNAILGEGPLWAEDENAVYWVDIPGKQVHRFTLTTKERQTWSFPFAVTSLAQRQNGGFICTLRDGFAYIDLDTGKIEPVAMPEADLPANRFNDGKLDARGRYWAGTMDDGGKLSTGSLYCLDEQHTVKKMDTDYIISNGPTFSADNTVLYHTDSARRTIYAFDFDINTGTVHNKRVFVRLQDVAEGDPDGMTVDSENCLWLCHFGGARITRYSPNGEVLEVVPMPCPNITSCTFAGENLDTLYITTARYGKTEAEHNLYPLGGSLFSYKPGVKGLPTARFTG